MKIYIVFGKTGEYSDRTEWPVVAYTQEIDAQSHVAAATAKAREIKAAIDTYDDDDYDGYAEEMCKTNQFDSRMQYSYTGASYHIEETELKEKRG